MTHYSHWTLNNGLRVLHAHRPWNKTFAASLGFNVGWCNETKRQQGLTHLIEHLAFCGDNQKLVDSLAEQGLSLNGITEWEQTYFPAFGHQDLFLAALDFYARILRGIKIDHSSVHTELAIILQELVNYEETAFDLELRKITARILGDPEIGQPYPRSIHNLSRLDAADISRYASQRFTPAGAILTIVSPHDPGQLQALLASVLGGISGDLAAFEPPPAREIAGHDRLITKRYRTPQVLCVVTYAYRPRERHPLAAVAMLSELLGGGQHSLLYKSMRRDAQLSYHFGTNLTVLNNAVLFQISAVIHRRNALAALRQVISYCRDLRSAGVSAEVLQRAKTRMLHGLDALEDDSSHLCEWLAHESWLTDRGQLVTPDTYRQQLEGISADQFNAIAHDLLQPQRRTTALLGGVGPWLRWRARWRLRKDRRSEGRGQRAESRD